MTSKYLSIYLIQTFDWFNCEIIVSANFINLKWQVCSLDDALEPAGYGVKNKFCPWQLDSFYAAH